MKIRFRTYGYAAGFTLIEILVVLAVLSVIAVGAVIVINPAKRIRQAQDARVKKDISEIASGLDAYYTKYRFYANDLSVLTDNQDLKTVPVPPVAGNYSVSTNPEVCTPESLNCRAAISFPLQDPALSGNLWCWRSQTGSFSEVQSCLP